MRTNHKIMLDTIKGSASDITKVLANLGNGHMKNGVARIAEHAFKDGMKVGNRKGMVKGAVIVIGVIGVGKILKEKYDEYKEHQKEGETIVEELQNAEDETIEEDM